MLHGRLILTQVEISLAETGAVDVTVSDANSSWISKHFNGFLLSRAASRIGGQPIINTQITALVGREIRACEYRIDSIKWLPLNLTAISWTGQQFRR